MVKRACASKEIIHPPLHMIKVSCTTFACVEFIYKMQINSTHAKVVNETFIMCNGGWIISFEAHALDHLGRCAVIFMVKYEDFGNYPWKVYVSSCWTKKKRTGLAVINSEWMNFFYTRSYYISVKVPRIIYAWLASLCFDS